MNCSATRLHSIETQLQVGMGPNLAVVCTGVDGDIGNLFPEELSAVSSAIPKRQREFAAGRTAAREAMRRLGFIGAPIPVNMDRSPRWPSGIVGSISHTNNVCLAVVGHQSHWQAIGVDVEPLHDIDESIWPMISTPEELHKIRMMPPSQQGLHATRIFVAKEAFYKWHYAQAGLMFDFLSTSVQWSEDRFNPANFTIAANPSLHLESTFRLKGSLLTLENHFIAICATGICHSNCEA